MRKIGIIAVLSLLVTALAAVPALAVTTTTISPENANSGTHFQVGTATCTLTGTTVTCSSYELAGVGNADAVADLAANYTATVDCRNHGGKIVPVKASVQGATASTGQIESKNGRLVVPALSTADVEEPTAEDFEALATCPNGNWTKETQVDTITLTDFTYTLTFVDKDTGEPLFPGPYITITGP